jgi:hypothetical protein
MREQTAIFYGVLDIVEGTATTERSPVAPRARTSPASRFIDLCSMVD